MSNPILSRVVIAAIALILGSTSSISLMAADYQWSVSIATTPLTGSEPAPELDPGYPRAFLWIPPDCKQVRAIVLAENNLEEESIFEDAGFRKTLSDLGFAEIWITTGSMLYLGRDK